MRKRVLNLAILLLAASLVSCASLPSLDSSTLYAPLEDPLMAEIASVNLPSFGRNWSSIHIDRIDNVRSYKFKVEHGIYRVPPGKKWIQIRYQVGSHSSAEGRLEVSLEAGKRYVPHGKRVRRNVVNMWIVDTHTGKAVSGILTKKLEWYSNISDTSGDE